MFPKKIHSICRECGRNVVGELVKEGGRVLLRKSCSEHGAVADLVSEEASLFERKGAYHEEARPLRCSVEKCLPGLCPDHLEHASTIAFVDITSRCNLNCPICYRDAHFKGRDVPYSHVEKILEHLAGKERPYVILVIGGEPTVHKDFLRICRRIDSLRLRRRTWVVTNGVKLADPDFCRRFRETGVKRIGLGFDGTTEDIYRKTRGSLEAFRKSRQALENLRKLPRTRATLCVTLMKGINEDNIPAILSFAMDNADIVKRLLFTMGTFCGRTEKADDLIANRVTQEGVERIFRDCTGSGQVSIPLSFFHKVSVPLPLLGMRPLVRSYPRILCNHCDGFAFIGRTRRGRMFSVPDRILRDPSRIFHDIERFETLSQRIESWKEKRGAGRLSILLARLRFLPPYWWNILRMIRPSLFLVPLKGLFLAPGAGGFIDGMREAVDGRENVKIWILPTGDKYNLVWEKIRNCTGHYFTYDESSDRIRKHAACFYFPYNTDVAERSGGGGPSRG